MITFEKSLTNVLTMLSAQYRVNHVKAYKEGEMVHIDVELKGYLFKKMYGQEYIDYLNDKSALICGQGKVKVILV